MVQILYYRFKGNTIERKIPRNLQRKITFLRSAWKRLLIGDDSDGYMKFLDRVEAAAETRHDIIHGVVIEQVERSGETIMVRAVRKRDGKIEKRRLHVTTENILRAALEAQDLSGKVLYWTDEVNNFIQHALQQSADKSGLTSES
jgi:hypothetical protein